MNSKPGSGAQAKWIMPPRFLLFLAGGPLLAAGLLPLVERWSQALLAGFDLAALVFLVSLLPLTRDDTPERMREHARTNDSGRVGMLIVTAALMLVITTAEAIELPDARKEQGLVHVLSLGLVLASLVVTWLFSNVIYALHYAHMFYREDGIGGLNFPEMRENGRDGAPDRCPDYWDFVYFSLTMGMAFATSDVEICRPDIRRIAMVHGLLAFFYNLIVLAFTINVTAGS